MVLVLAGSGASVSPSGESVHIGAVVVPSPGVGLVGCGGSWGGSVGANFGKDNRDGRLFVREVPPEMAAAHAGLRAGDEVVAIDGKPTTSMTPEEVDRALRGRVGSTVTLSIVRRGQPIEVKVERGPMK